MCLFETVFCTEIFFFHLIVCYFMLITYSHSFTVLFSIKKMYLFTKINRLSNLLETLRRLLMSFVPKIFFIKIPVPLFYLLRFFLFHFFPQFKLF